MEMINASNTKNDGVELMIHSLHYDPYFPEPGVRYFINDESAVIIWEGFFDNWFLQNINQSTCPQEFIDYKNLEGWKDLNPKSVKINTMQTIESLKMMMTETRKNYRDAYVSLLDYLTNNLDQEIFIEEYL